MERDTAETSELPVFAAVNNLWWSIRDLVGDLLELATLETRNAGRAAVAMVAMAIIGAFCLMAAWLSLCGALAFWIAGWIGWIAAFLLVAFLNVAGAVALVLAIMRLSRLLTFRATRQALSLGPSAEAEHVPAE